MKRYLLGIDVGTSTVKAVLVDEMGLTVGSAHEEYKTYYPHTGWAEQEPEDWWLAARRVIAGVMANTGCQSGRDIIAVSISCQAPTLLAVDAQGVPLSRAMIWMDRRCDAQCQRLGDQFGRERFFAITGNSIDPFYVLPKILWFKENRPELYEKTRYFLQINGYINYRLTGNFSMDQTHSTLIGVYDYRTGLLARDLCDTPCVDVDAAKFPSVYANDAIIGTVTREAAEQTGLAPGTPVVAGTVDGAAAAVEGGIVATGDAVEMSGTSSVLLLGSAQPHPDPCLTYMYHQIPGLHLSLGCMSTTGAAYRWFRNEMLDQADGYEEMNRRILRDAPGPTGLIFLPYMSGERAPIWDTTAKGTWLGITLAAKQGQMLRSIQEGASFALRHNMEYALNAGMQIVHLRCTGGHTNSDIWMKIKASVVGMPIDVVVAGEGAPWGAALLGGTAVKMFSSLRETTDRCLRIREVVEPDPHWQAYYQEQYELYKASYQALKSLYPALHAHQSSLP